MSRHSSGSSAASGGGSTSAIPFLQCDAKGKFQLMPEAAKILNGIKTKICPVVVAGPYRSGKSSLLNLLLDRNVKGAASGFAVGGSVQACTKGLWLWAEPLTIGDMTYVFIDSEGLGSTDQNAQFDTEVFSLSILLSSLFVLNTSGTINEGTLEQLELVVQMTERIRVREENKKSGQTSLSELAQFFPSFLWVLRDFSLALENARGDAITSNEYLEEALRPVSIGAHAKKGAQEKNRIRSAISTVFPNRHCVTMVRPVVEESDLKKVSSMPASALRAEFRQQLEQVKNLIPQLAVPKSVEGVQLNGRAYVSLAANYVSAINSGSIPTIRTAFQSVQEIQSREAMDHALADAKKSLATVDAKLDKQALSEDDLNSALASIESAALSLIQEEALGNASDLTKLCQHFTTTYLQGLFQATRERNNSRAEKFFQSTAEGLWEDAQIEGYLHTFNSYKELNTVVSGYWSKYMSLTKNKGPATVQMEVGRNFLDKKREVIFRFLYDKIASSNSELEKSKQANQANQKEISKLKEELQALRQEQAVERNKFDLELKQSTKDLTRAQAQQTETEKKLHQAEERARKERAQLEQANVDSSKSFNQQLNALQTQVSTLQSSLTTAELELKSNKKEIQRLEKQADAAASDSASAAETRRQLSALQSELHAKETTLRKTEATHETLKGKYAAFENTLKQVTAEIDSKDASIHAKDARIRQLENEIGQASQLPKQVDQQQKEIQALRQQLAQAQQQQAAAASYGSNPLGLPPPTDAPLVSRGRTSLLPTSFKPAPAAGSARKSTSKRKSEVLPEEPEDFDMVPGEQPDEEEDDDSSDDESNARPAAAAAASRSSMPGAQAVRDPQSLSINELKSWLTSMDVTFPQKAQPKAFYVDLIYSSPAAAEVEKQFPKGQPKKKGKK